MTGLAWTTRPPEGSELARLAAGVGQRLLDARVAAGYPTAAAFARASHVSVATIRALERGVQRPAWPTLVRLANALFPADRARAEAFAVALAELAGPSLAGPPDLPVTVTRELAVRVLGVAAVRLGFDLDDDAIRHVVAEELRRATREGYGESPAVPVAVVHELEGGAR